METRAPRAGLFSMRHLARIALLCGLLLRGMIPGSYMPNFDAVERQGFLVICSSIGEQIVPLNGERPMPTDTHQYGVCSFSMLATALPLLAAIVLLLWLSPRNILYRLPCIALGSRRFACALPAARAPPALA